MTVWFTSDHHFGHENIIKFCDRPFSSVEEMDEEMIKRWNAVVKDTDTVYHLGDFTLFNGTAASRYFAQLNGMIKVLRNTWHHDKRWIPKHADMASEYRSKTGSVVTFEPPIVVLEFPEYENGSDKYSQALVLCHYPLAVWDRKHYGSWHIHGHSHGQFLQSGLCLDVGVDDHDFCPVPLRNVEHIMEGLKELL